MSLPSDKFEMVAADWVKQGANIELPLDLPWPRQLKKLDEGWKSQPETGINVFVLMHESKKRGYKSPYWLTLREGENANAVLKDEQVGVQVASWRWRSKDDNFSGDISEKVAMAAQDPIAVDEDPKAVAMRPVVVFNLEQWEGVENVPSVEYHAPSCEEAMESAQMIESTEAPCEIKFSPDGKAFYNPSLNYIQMPSKESFSNLRDYYLALFEQFGHALASKHNMDLWEEGSELSKDVNFQTLYARMVAAMLAYESGIEVLV